MLKNVKVGMRIIIGFVIIIALIVTLSLISVNAINRTANLSTLLSQAVEVTDTVAYIQLKASENIQTTMQMGLSNDKAVIDENYKHSQDSINEMLAELDLLNSIFGAQAGDAFNALKAQVNGLSPVLDSIYAEAVAGNTDAYLALFTESYQPAISLFEQSADAIAEETASAANAEYVEINDLIELNLIIVFAGLGAIVVVAVIVALSLTKSIKKPVTECVAAAKSIANGDLSVEIEYKAGDELGELADSIRGMVKALKEYVDDISYVTQEVAGGNLDVQTKAKYLGEFVAIDKSLARSIGALNTTFKGMEQASDQVAVGANEVSRGAQALAQGATEQSGSIEQLSETISIVNDQIQNNATNARQTRDIMNNSGALVAECNNNMDDLLESMREIDISSAEIGKIIKVIDDISFQTNILAINAAVEAARAGDAGKGFAVVADEVRNLATKSAQAAKETAALIEGSMEKVQEGNRHAEGTAKVLKAIVEDATSITQKLETIAAESENQAQSIADISTAVEQISMVVQTNSATAQESAAASEELSGQADTMKNMVMKYKLKRDENDFGMMGQEAEVEDFGSFDFSGLDKY